MKPGCSIRNRGSEVRSSYSANEFLLGTKRTIIVKICGVTSYQGRNNKWHAGACCVPSLTCSRDWIRAVDVESLTGCCWRHCDDWGWRHRLSRSSWAPASENKHCDVTNKSEFASARLHVHIKITQRRHYTVINRTTVRHKTRNFVINLSHQSQCL